MIASQLAIDGDRLHNALILEAARRETARLRDGLRGFLKLDPAQLQLWEQTWDKSARMSSMSFEDALSLAKNFLNPVLDAKVRGLHWKPAERTWTTGSS